MFQWSSASTMCKIDRSALLVSVFDNQALGPDLGASSIATLIHLVIQRTFLGERGRLLEPSVNERCLNGVTRSLGLIQTAL